MRFMNVLQAVAFAAVFAVFNSCAQQSALPISATLDLPRPSELARQTADTYNDSLNGAEWSSSLTPIGVVSNGDMIEMTPDPPAADLSKYSFALFDFNVPDFVGEPQV